jgi:LacI family transcriptional regulator/LacI family repressor for deo operon, udp, cdd, tsx, nupC, and nupG
MAAPLADLGSAAVAELLAAQHDEPGADPAPVTMEATLLARATTGRARD